MHDQNSVVGEHGSLQTDSSVDQAAREPDSSGGPDGQRPPAQRTGAPPPLAELDQWVTAERLREIVWDQASRPSMQWIRKETKRRMLPHVRRGRLIFYRPRSVLDWYMQRESRPASMQ
jgi:hypothetical protein